MKVKPLPLQLRCHQCLRVSKSVSCCTSQAIEFSRAPSSGLMVIESRLHSFDTLRIAPQANDFLSSVVAKAKFVPRLLSVGFSADEALSL